MWWKCYLRAIDYQTGKSRWKHDLGSGWNWAGVLSTAGGLVFTADVHGNILALDAETGKTLCGTVTVVVRPKGRRLPIHWMDVNTSSSERTEYSLLSLCRKLHGVIRDLR